MKSKKTKKEVFKNIEELDRKAEIAFRQVENLQTMAYYLRKAFLT